MPTRRYNPWKARIAARVTGYAGYVDHTAKNRESGTTIVIVKADAAGLDPDGGPYVTICEKHDTCVNHETLHIAKHFMRHPTVWCEPCQELATDKQFEGLGDE